MQTINYSTEKLLSNLNIDALNDMQVAAIEAIETNNNILLLSSTGSGKTLAFLIPILQKLDAQIKKTQALIIVPSRE
ncbi:MAG: DEAD/DEAH box helicase, partial [Chitinophagaceae bacterium]